MIKLLRLVFRFFFRWYGWKLDWGLPRDIKKCVMVASPHTSNWDMVYGLAAFDMMRIPVRFTIKKEWMRFPMSLILKPLGGIGIDRSPKEGSQERKSMVEAMVELFDQYDELVVLVTPEGSRSRRDQWRTGFYYVALKAKVPIGLGYLNYGKKEAGVGKILYPTGDIDRDMREIMDFYRPMIAKFPENFSLDKRWS